MIPLSVQQEIVWLHQELAPQSSAYHFTAVVDLVGELDVRRLTQSLDAVVDHHPGLRLALVDRAGGEPGQRIAEGVSARVVEHDLRGSADQEAEFGKLVTEHAVAPFDLAAAPLLRWLLVRTADDRVRLVHTEHHLIHDGRSFAVFLTDLFAAYEALGAGAAPRLAPVVGYDRYVADCASEAHRAEREEAVRWWGAELADADFGATFRGLAGSLAPRTGFTGAQYRQALPSGLVRRLHEVAREQGHTPFSVLYGLFSELLRRHAGQDDIVLGTAVGNRPGGYERTIGMMVNTLAVRLRHEAAWSGAELVDAAMERLFAALDHESAPIQHVVREIGASGGALDNPLFRVMFSLHDSRLPRIEVPGLRVDLVEGLNPQGSRFDVDVVVLPGRRSLDGAADDELTLVWDYSTERFDEAALHTLAARYERLLASYLDAPGTPVRSLAMVDGTPVPAAAPAAETIPELGGRLAAAFAAHADRTALRHGTEELSYAGLAARVDARVRELTAGGVRPGHVVASWLPRGPEAVVQLLACLRAGFVHAPLPENAPAARVAAMVRRLRPAVLYAPERAALGGADAGGIRPTVPGEDPAGGVPAGARRLEAAYVIHTSGSTGVPKAVAVPLDSLSAAVDAAVGAYGLHAQDRVLQFTAPAFDVFLEEVLPALVVGAALVLPRTEVPAGPDLAALVTARGVTVLNLPTGYLSGVAAEFADALGDREHELRLVVVGGERLPSRLVERIGAIVPGGRILNAYGVTEATITSAVHECAPDGEDGEVPIGRPLPGTALCVVDEEGRALPPGVPGELAIGGLGAGCWYVDDPELTGRRFPELAGPPAGRYYRTGDLAHQHPDGTFRFLGRKDNQIKLHGLRIEPEEIEVEARALLGGPDCAVVLDTAQPTGPRLVGFVEAADEAALQPLSRLSGAVARGMLPALWVPLPALPRLPGSGKTDRRALALRAAEAVGGTGGAGGGAQTGSGSGSGSGSAADAGVALVTEGFRHVLDRAEVGPYDDFFAVGGNSLLVARLAAWLEQRTGTRPPMRTVFENSRPVDLAPLLPGAGAR
ncbi:condensation domain-containing protein [Streptomyces sp. NPDC127106]|uniref:non-ribosomal peptide synthetase n=1 Tax=Streptomyces sp. NPDC127106 TaxID=3345360 RepID=UPI0036257191